MPDEGQTFLESGAILLFLFMGLLPVLKNIWLPEWLSLEKAIAPHSSTLAWKIPWTEESGELHLWGCTESDMTEAT